MKPEFEKIASDVPGSEGPVFDLKSRFFCVAPSDGHVLEILPGGKKRIHADTGGIPAGLQVDRQNRLWLADMKLCILRIDEDGKIETVTNTIDGQPMRGCNDDYFDSKGNLYFTAPAGSNFEKPLGEVFCYTADGRTVRIDSGYRFSNGLAVTADDSTLIVAETGTKSLWAYEIKGPGKVGPRRLWAKLPSDDQGGPDGMDFDCDGNLLVAHYAGHSIDLFDPNAQLLDRIEAPVANPTNVHFGGDDGCWVYMTEISQHCVWRFHYGKKGQPQFCDAARR